MTTTHTRRHAGGLLLGLTGLLGAALTAPAAAQPAFGPADADSATVAAGAAEIAGAERAARKPKRALRVRVKRPTEAKKLVKVTVKGPRQPGKRKKFKKTFKRTKTFKRLRPGTYRIKARTITLFDQRIKPTVVKKKVRIKKRTKRKVSRVRYAAPVFCATSGSTAYGWGEGDHGRLGTPVSTDRLAPVVIPRIRGLKAITGGLRSTYGLCADGSVWSWGFNGKGELGIGKSGNRSWPVRVPGLTGVTAIAAGRETGYALKSDGSVWAWGAGSYGELGNGRSGFGYQSTVPVRVSLPQRATAIAAGGYSAYAILGDTRVAAWGNGGLGQRGNGTTGESTPTPVVVSDVLGAEQLVAGHATAYVKSGPTIHAWGDNGEREVPRTGGAPPPSYYTTPYPEVVGPELDLIGASNSAGWATLGANVYGWGSGRYHDVGRDVGASPAEPALNPGFPTDVTAFAGAGYGGYALTGSGQVWAWGSNSAGQVGTGAPKTGPAATQGLLPARITALSGVTAIGAGVTNGYALR